MNVCHSGKFKSMAPTVPLMFLLDQVVACCGTSLDPRLASHRVGRACWLDSSAWDEWLHTEVREPSIQSHVMSFTERGNEAAMSSTHVQLWIQTKNGALIPFSDSSL